MKNKIVQLLIVVVIFCIAMFGLLTLSNWEVRVFTGKWYEPFIGFLFFIIGFFMLGFFNHITSKDTLDNNNKV